MKQREKRRKIPPVMFRQADSFQRLTQQLNNPPKLSAQNHPSKDRGKAPCHAKQVGTGVLGRVHGRGWVIQTNGMRSWVSSTQSFV